ncbi:hypothetical protein HXX76_005899 [Chlamydomonas incerta]|uniref:Uncharacterized protein n=1 Tax=Chlamydomonas incerta TaxID=51695 RepID=A0A835T4I5_CHLIN|nr:hypothetical protein HXX76_005899 [Chlamydomonas incerta]|eukprot:KAG2437236.1 hypothetical protein HXX76_005899 [Chlamydomonas incerta]
MQPGDLDLTLPGTACGPDPLDEAAAIAFDLPPERRRTSFYPFTLSSRTPSCDCPTAELASLAALAAAQGGDGSGSGGGYGYCASAPPHSPQQGPDAAGPCLITAYIGGTSDPLWQLGGGRTSVASVASTGGHASVRSLSMPGSSPAVPAAAGMAAGGGADVEEECEIFERHTYGGYGGRAHAHGGNVHPWNAGKEVDAAAAATAVGAAAAVVGAAAAAAATAQAGLGVRAAAGAQVAAALTTKSTGTLLQLPDIHSGAHHAHHAHAAHHHRHQHQHDGDDDPHHPQGYHYLHQQQEQDARLARAQARSRSRGGWRHSDCGEYSFAATAAATGGIGAGGGGGGGTSRRFADCGGDTECGGVCSSRNRCPSSTCSGAYGSYAGEEGWRVGASGSLGSGTGPASSARTASVLHGVATSCGQGGADVGAFACGGGGGGGGGGGCGPGSGQLPQFSRSSASLAATAVGLGGAGATALAATTGHSTAVPLSGPGTGYLRINLRAALPGTVTSRAALAADLVRCLSHARRHARGGSASGGDGSGGGASPTASATPSPLMGEGGYMRARSRRERA